ncbi:MAG: hypothetical protein QNJ64_08320 [Crocosphaera sp.]|nr:hypothetical protein [Crocosphaera sp.]
MGNNNSYQPFQSDSTEAIKSDILTHSNQHQSEEPSEVMDVTIVADTDAPFDQDWFDLARKLRGQNRELLDTIVKLEQSLATSRQQLQDYQKQSLHHNSLVSQQTVQLQTTQAQNTNLIKQLEESHHQGKQQQEELKVLQEGLNTLKETVANLERDYAVLKEENRGKNKKIALQEQQISELQQRLQRQQRYSLQYKAALDECLSSGTQKIPTQESTENGIMTPNASPSMVSIQPWSSPTASNSSQSSEEPNQDTVVSDSIDSTLEAFFSLSPVEDNSATPQPEESSPEGTEQNPIQNQDDDLQSPSSNSANGLLVSSSVPFSFSIDRHRKEDAAKDKVDLPSFLRRQ